ncbi:MAG: hypothetical protein FJW96_05780 [Actinobacteria bacterium]|nr:hypothetical protein [Actinomycetota bacterium]
MTAILTRGKTVVVLAALACVAACPLVLPAATVASPSALPPQAGVVDLLTQANVRIVGGRIGSWAGFSVAAAGDVDGDGRNDVVVGAPGGRKGAAYVVFGRRQLGTVDLSNLGNRGFRIVGAAGTSVGASVAGLGDVNGDGRGDLVVGAPYAVRPGRGRSGAAFVVFGKASPEPVRLGRLGDGGFRIDGAVPGDLAGVAVAAAGDVNGDGRPDVVVGASAAGNRERATSGSAYVVFGKATPATVDLAALGRAGLRIDGATPAERAGTSVAGAGDVNGDGYADIAVGAPGASAAGRAGSGVAYVVLGSPAPAAIDLAAPGARGYRIDGADTDDETGFSIAGGRDVNGDGRPDLVVGAPGARANGRIESGSAFVVYGKADTAPIDLATLGAGGYRIDGAAISDAAGRSVALAGDVNGDGVADVVVGATLADNRDRDKSGTAYVVFGRPAAANVDLNVLGAAGLQIDGSYAIGFAGRSVAGVGDMNGDGRDDIAIGAPSADDDGRGDAGSASVVLGFGPPRLAYAPVLASVGRALRPVPPSSLARTGAPRFSVSPELPAGLTLDRRTGALKGTPAMTLPQSSFTVTMTDLTGSVTADLPLAVIRPDARAPGTTLAAKDGQRLLRAGGLYVSGSCDEACVLSLDVVVRAPGRKGEVRLIEAIRTLTRPQTTSFRVVFASDARAKLRKLLASGKGVAAITLEAVDPSGNAAERTLTVAVER